MELWSIPGYIADGAFWRGIFGPIAETMTLLDGFLVMAGLGLTVYAVWPEKQQDKDWPGPSSTPRHYPVSPTSVDSKEAYQQIRASPLVAPVPDWSKDSEKPEWEEIQQRKEEKANLLAAMYLQDFKLECPDAVRDGRVGFQTLLWWIGKKIQERDA